MRPRILGWALALGVLALASAAGAQTTTTTSTSTSSTSTTSTSTSTTTSTSLASTAWQVIQNGNCTGDIAATGITSAVVNCCTASGQGFCDRRENMGTLFLRYVTLGTGTPNTYLTGGSLLSTAALAKLGITNIVSMQCFMDSLGQAPVINFGSASGTRAVKIKLFTSGAEVTNGTTTANTSMECYVWGY